MPEFKSDDIHHTHHVKLAKVCFCQISVFVCSVHFAISKLSLYSISVLGILLNLSSSFYFKFSFRQIIRFILKSALNNAVTYWQTFVPEVVCVGWISSIFFFLHAFNHTLVYINVHFISIFCSRTLQIFVLIYFSANRSHAVLFLGPSRSYSPTVFFSFMKTLGI